MRERVQDDDGLHQHREREDGKGVTDGLTSGAVTHLSGGRRWSKEG